MAAVQQPSHQQKGAFSGSWSRVRKNSKTSLLDLGPPLRVPVSEADDSQLHHTVPGASVPERRGLRHCSPSPPSPPRARVSSSRPPHPPKTSASSSSSVASSVPSVSTSNPVTSNSLPQSKTLQTHPASLPRPPHPPQAPHPPHPPQVPHPPHPPQAPQAPNSPQAPGSTHCPPNLPLMVFPAMKKDNIVEMTIDDEQKRFLKLSLLGRGGSSKVFKVMSESCELYALKEIYLKHLDSAVKRAYITEINFLKQLKNVSEVITLHYFNWDKEEGVLSLLLEYGETDLAAIIRDRGPSIPTALYFWKEMLNIMKVVHDHGTIHNDLKPENFVCVRGRLKLIDFGIANRIEDEHTSVNRDLCCGTISYMSPETIETYGDNTYFKVGRPSDVWSLGCILYQMVYGHTPFEHFKKLQRIQAITDPATKISFPDVGNPAAMDVMRKCLARNPKERPTVKDLLSHPFTLGHCS